MGGVSSETMEMILYTKVNEKPDGQHEYVTLTTGFEKLKRGVERIVFKNTPYKSKAHAFTEALYQLPDILDRMEINFDLDKDLPGVKQKYLVDYDEDQKDGWE